MNEQKYNRKIKKNNKFKLNFYRVTYFKSKFNRVFRNCLINHCFGSRLGAKTCHCCPIGKQTVTIENSQSTENHGVQRMMISVDNFFVFFEIIIFCFVVAICDLVHDVITIFHLSYLLTASGNLF